MIIILPSNGDRKTECLAWEKPADWFFMEESGKILKNLPTTWRQYPVTEEGMVGIIDMEYNEFKRATTLDAMKQELIHLSTACLRLWRKLSDVK